VRDSARTALAAAAAGLGAAHLPRVVSLLSNRLDRGFMTHVLGATLFSLLDAAVPGADPEDVEAALPEIMPLIDADLFGRAAEEREVEAIRGAYVEARRSRSHECLTLLASNAVVPRALPELLSPVTRRLAAASSPSLRRKLEACLVAVQKGLLLNPHATPEEMLILVHSVVHDGVAAEERLAAEAAAPDMEEMTLGQGLKGHKETGNRVWENGWWGSACVSTLRPSRASDYLHTVYPCTLTSRSFDTLQALNPLPHDPLNPLNASTHSNS
jgi:U3 small nucleolar RNA-associated protein 20